MVGGQGLLARIHFKPFAVIHLCFLWYVILKWIQNPKCICTTCMDRFIVEHLLPDGHWHKKTTGKASFLLFAAHSLVFPIHFELCRES